MGIIKAVKLAFDYLKYDEDGNVQETQRAVDGVDVDIREGQFVAILGHNGSGKSTFAKHINALLLPSDDPDCSVRRHQYSGGTGTVEGTPEGRNGFSESR